MTAAGSADVVASSAWLAYFADEPTASDFAPVIEALDALVVPTICIYEVVNVIARLRGEERAAEAASVMSRGRAIDLDAALAVRAAELGAVHKLPLADSIVYATAQAVGGVVWTQDADFERLPDVRYVPKRPAT